MTTIGPVSGANLPFLQRPSNNQIIAALAGPEAEAAKTAAISRRPGAIPAPSLLPDSFEVSETAKILPGNPTVFLGQSGSGPFSAQPFATGQPLSMSPDMQAALLAAQEVSGGRTGASEKSTTTDASEAAATKAIAEDFLELAAMSPVERYIHSLLQSLGLTEETLAQLPPEERTKIETMIKEKMREKFGV